MFVEPVASIYLHYSRSINVWVLRTRWDLGGSRSANHMDATNTRRPQAKMISIPRARRSC